MNTLFLNRIANFLTREKNTGAKRNTKVKPSIETLEDRMLLDHGLSALGETGLSHGAGCGCPGCNVLDSTKFAYADETIIDNNQGDLIADITSNFSLSDKKWTVSTITYSYSNLLNGGIRGLTNSQIRSAIEEAFRLWANYAPLHFAEKPDSGPAVSMNNYNAGSHPIIRIGHLSIDGPGNTLAHAFYPENDGLAGDIHFDNSESWTVGLFLEVAVHEIGHALGLKHETQVNAIMNPSIGGRYSGLGTSYLLQDDINGIQAFYGNGKGSVTPLSDKLGTAVPTGPTGTISNTMPTFQWTAASNATWYYLYVFNNTTNKLAFKLWVEGAISYQHNAPLAAGNYTFWVQPWGNNQYGGWSNGMEFRVEVARPGTATPTGPSGMINSTTPAFQWNAASNATWYYLYVFNNTTNKLAFKLWVEGATSYRHNAPLAAGNYTFWVQTWGNGQYGDWSTDMQFRVEVARPGIATLIGPSGTTNTTTPTFQWNAVSNATWYYLYIQNRDTGQVHKEWVEGQTSFQSSTSLARGNYTFWVQTWGNGMYGDWSDGLNFSIV